ncbi:hypothetical protein EDD86DRAFT_101576 [Gorgonomyces haynaldii]|nr:hypothetical protein EDD86DRAFT_101576 [Gorgonomyces haynaldii]
MRSTSAAFLDANYEYGLAATEEQVKRILRFVALGHRIGCIHWLCEHPTTARYMHRYACRLYCQIAYCGSMEALQYCLTNLQKSRKIPHWHETALACVAGRGHFDMMKMQLSLGADINDADPDELYALHSAVENNRLDAAKFHVECGSILQIELEIEDNKVNMLVSE